jgi:Na+-transporting methylmalonyl-CoA/oxaloacetate decarboxylase gamma subunit
MTMQLIYFAQETSFLDSLSLTIVVVGIGVALLSLLILYWFFKYLITSVRNLTHKTFARKKETAPAEVQAAKTVQSGEVNAAIAMAIYEYFNELHDVESGVVTIKRVSRHYSPWSSKLYNMKNL